MQWRESRLVVGGVAVGAGLMYVLDPGRGTRRRALIRDRGRRVVRRATGGIDATARDLAHRSRGLLAGTRRRWRSEVAGDEILEARVRSVLGRLVAHPSAIDVTVHQGRVTLGGPVLREEVGALVAAVRRVRGVEQVRNELVAYEEGGRVPSLQGGRPRGGRRGRRERLRARWSPTARLLVGTIGGLAALRAVRARRPAALALATAGAAALARAAANRPVSDLFAMFGARKAGDRRAARPGDAVLGPAAKGRAAELVGQ